MNGDTPLFRTMARLFAAQAGLYCVPALIAGIIGIALFTAVSLAIFPAAHPTVWDPLTSWQSLTVGGKLIAVFGLLFALWLPILLGARGVCRIATEQISSRRVSVAQIVVDMLKFLPAALLYSLVIGLPTMIGFSILYVPCLLIAALFALVVPTGVNEPGGIFATLGRGVSLAMKVYGGLFLLTLACTAMMILVTVLRIFGLDRFLTGAPATMFALRFAVMYIPGLLLLVLANICFTLVYMHARGAEAKAAVASGPQSG
jgi:hypothetical protein